MSARTAGPASSAAQFTVLPRSYSEGNMTAADRNTTNTANTGSSGDSPWCCGKTVVRVGSDGGNICGVFNEPMDAFCVKCGAPRPLPLPLLAKVTSSSSPLPGLFADARAPPSLIQSPPRPPSDTFSPLTSPVSTPPQLANPTSSFLAPVSLIPTTTTTTLSGALQPSGHYSSSSSSSSSLTAVPSSFLRASSSIENLSSLGPPALATLRASLSTDSLHSLSSVNSGSSVGRGTQETSTSGLAISSGNYMSITSLHLSASVESLHSLIGSATSSGAGSPTLAPITSTATTNSAQSSNNSGSAAVSSSSSGSAFLSAAAVAKRKLTVDVSNVGVMNSLRSPSRLELSMLQSHHSSSRTSSAASSQATSPKPAASFPSGFNHSRRASTTGGMHSMAGSSLSPQSSAIVVPSPTFSDRQGPPVTFGGGPPISPPRRRSSLAVPTSSISSSSSVDRATTASAAVTAASLFRAHSTPLMAQIIPSNAMPAPAAGSQSVMATMLHANSMAPSPALNDDPPVHPQHRPPSPLISGQVANGQKSGPSDSSNHHSQRHAYGGPPRLHHATSTPMHQSHTNPHIIAVAAIADPNLAHNAVMLQANTRLALTLGSSASNSSSLPHHSHHHHHGVKSPPQRRDRTLSVASPILRPLSSAPSQPTAALSVSSRNHSDSAYDRPGGGIVAAGDLAVPTSSQGSNLAGAANAMTTTGGAAAAFGGRRGTAVSSVDGSSGGTSPGGAGGRSHRRSRSEASSNNASALAGLSLSDLNSLAQQTVDSYTNTQFGRTEANAETEALGVVVATSPAVVGTSAAAVPAVDGFGSRPMMERKTSRHKSSHSATSHRDSDASSTSDFRLSIDGGSGAFPVRDREGSALSLTSSASAPVLVPGASFPELSGHDVMNPYSSLSVYPLLPEGNESEGSPVHSKERTLPFSFSGAVPTTASLTHRPALSPRHAAMHAASAAATETGLGPEPHGHPSSDHSSAPNSGRTSPPHRAAAVAVSAAGMTFAVIPPSQDPSSSDHNSINIEMVRQEPPPAHEPVADDMKEALSLQHLHTHLSAQVIRHHRSVSHEESHWFEQDSSYHRRNKPPPLPDDGDEDDQQRAGLPKEEQQPGPGQQSLAGEEQDAAAGEDNGMDSTSVGSGGAPVVPHEREGSYLETGSHSPSLTWRVQLMLAMNALGVIYGDIGTSPLYVFSSIFSDAPSPDDVVGACSLIIWSITLVVSIKYVMCILTADSNGEGGTFALLSLLRRYHGPNSQKYNKIWTIMAFFGSSMLIGDGIITPAISVLSAVEGIAIASPAFGPVVVPVTCIILFLLFMLQRFGTAKVGVFFGPIMLLWFLSLAFIGAYNISYAPSVLQAFSPHYGFQFFMRNGFNGWVQLGAIVLCVTGVEAMFADLGHFGLLPIRVSWLGLVYPALLLAYIGQAARLLDDSSIITNTFYLSMPGAIYWPMIVLSTFATVIASQALISGAFSLINAAVKLQFLPRVRVIHTSEDLVGQIYIPEVNYALMVSTIIVVVAFQHSAKLANAYGVAVCFDMMMTSIFFINVMSLTRNTPSWRIVCYAVPYLIIDGSFLSANLSKVATGGWLPLSIACTLASVMYIWNGGRKLVNDLPAAHPMKLEQLTQLLTSSIGNSKFISPKATQLLLGENPVSRVDGIGIFFTSTEVESPAVLVQLMDRLHVLPRRVVLLTVRFLDIPFVRVNDRLRIEDIGGGLYRAVALYGYAQNKVLAEDLAHGILHYLATIDDCDTEENFPIYESRPENAITYFLGRHTIIARPSAPLMRRIHIACYNFLARNSRMASSYFHIPPHQLIEIGTQTNFG